MPWAMPATAVTNHFVVTCVIRCFVIWPPCCYIEKSGIEGAMWLQLGIRWN